MSNLANIVSKIKEILLTVTGVGTKVYDYERYAADWATFINYFKSDSKVNGWEIAVPSSTETEDTPSVNIRTHTIKIFGYYSLDDTSASEKTFRALTEAVCDKFRNYQVDLDGTAFMSSGASVNVRENRMFGSVLCHFCEIQLNVQEHIQWR
jgi:hypothetical protein